MAAQRPIHWVKDADVSQCITCQKAFGLTVRKHHCRACGLIFCNECSQGRVEVPSQGYNDKVRVCDGCMKTESQRNEVERVHKGVLKNGALFTKHAEGLGLPKEKWVVLSSDEHELLWCEPKDKGEEKKAKRIVLSTVEKVVAGHTTKAFSRTGKKGTEDQCFSIIAADRSLDLEASSQEVRDAWMEAIQEYVTVKNLKTPAELQEEEKAKQRRNARQEEMDRRKAERQKHAESIRNKYM